MAPCPDFITGFDNTRMAYKTCDEDATWFKHPLSNHTWSNYTTCVNLDDLEWRQSVNLTYETGYSISLIALIISLALLSYFRSLRCARITMHMNLFASFGLNNALWLLWYRTVVADPQVIIDNGIGCRVLHVILHYFLLTNYSWMAMEGLYLHTVLVSAFASERKLLHYLIPLGWTAPGIVITLYAALRSQSPPDTEQCWMNESWYSTVLVVPVCLYMVLNLVLLCNIVRVLLVKLRAGPHHGGSSGPSSTALQAFRATLLLVPLLGLHYLLTPFRPPPGHSWERVYEMTSAITASFQGLCVATLFCFCNGEVMAQLKRRWNTLMFRPRANSCSATTVSVNKNSKSFIRATSHTIPGEQKV
ncbi:calcitonin gene-related peptide type 1 receptor-like [Ctenocephalides felis]|nr:calcitonin gene-related peptide type 1 receptor-like [Ctenocephalides felis]